MSTTLRELKKHFELLCVALSKKEIITNPWLEKRIAEIKELFSRIENM